MLSPSSVLNAQFIATVNLQTVSPIIDTLPIVLPLSFTDTSDINVMSGTFTPNNNVITLFNTYPLSLAAAPTFLIVVCDAQINLEISYSDGSSTIDPINAFAFYSTVQNDARFISNLYINGQASNTPPAMPQNVPVNYTIIIGKATISI